MVSSKLVLAVLVTMVINVCTSSLFMEEGKDIHDDLSLWEPGWKNVKGDDRESIRAYLSNDGDHRFGVPGLKREDLQSRGFGGVGLKREDHEGFGFGAMDAVEFRGAGGMGGF